MFGVNVFSKESCKKQEVISCFLCYNGAAGSKKHSVRQDPALIGTKKRNVFVSNTML